MRDLFPGWIPPDEETLDRYWREATFAVDASVLLDLYRFSEEARVGLLEALRSFGDRLWVPHQVALEFHRNRFGVLLDQREAEGKLLSELDQIRDELDEQLSKRLRGAGRRDLAPLRQAVDGGFEQLREKLKEAEEAHTKGLGKSIYEDPVYDEVVGLCDECIGPSFDDGRRKEVVADAESRFRSDIPPGYLDKEKPGDARFGDVFLWHQLCDKATETGKPIVLVADDQKTDWVWEVRGKRLGPRPELVAEMKEKAAVGFHLYTPGRLLEIWGERNEGRQVEPEVLEEIRSSEADPIASAFHDNLVRWTTQQLLGQVQEPEKSQFALEGLSPHSMGPITHNTVSEGSVELGLTYFRVAKDGVVPGMQVTVTDPDGRESSCVAFPMGGGDAEVLHSVMARYPGNFDAAGLLAPGRYTVVWRRFTISLETDGPRETFEEFARDSFIVLPGQTG